MAGLTLTLAAETNALSVQRSLVLGGHGWTVLPPIAVADDLKDGRLSGAPLADPAITRTIVSALPASHQIGRHVRCVHALLTECAGTAVREQRWPQGRWLRD